MTISVTATPHMARLLIVMAVLGSSTMPAHAVTMDMVNVGDPGNASDTINPYPFSNYGAVPHEYRIGKYEVTIGQYTAFLNAVVKKADHAGSLYVDQMATEYIAGIARSGSSGSYTYTAIGPFGTAVPGADSAENRPITFVSWWDAARFANWMSNGQPTGDQGPATTENGAYAVSIDNLSRAPAANITNPNTGATPLYRIPTEDEWYKAAFYKGGGSNSGYWTYATQSDSPPGNTIGGEPNQANYIVGESFAVAEGPFYSGQNYLTNVGAFSGSPSAYGTFDQSGNVREWNDLGGVSDTNRGIRGGEWESDRPSALSSAGGGRYPSTLKMVGNLGFRLATSTDLLFMMPSGTIRSQGQALYPLLTPEIASSVTVASGTVVFDAANTYSGPTLVKNATLEVRSANALRLTPITVKEGGILALPTDTSLTVAATSLTVDQNTGGLVDVGRGRIDIAPGGITADALRADLLAGRAEGTYAGTGGITSSVAAAEISGGQPRAVGWLDNGGGSFTVAYAAPGDTNCDWTVDILDAANVLAGGRFDAGPVATWSEGDFTYDQVVDILDAADFVATDLFDAGNYNVSTSGLTAVPEPSFGAAALVGLAASCWRRPRRSGRRARPRRDPRTS